MRKMNIITEAEQESIFCNIGNLLQKHEGEVHEDILTRGLFVLRSLSFCVGGMRQNKLYYAGVVFRYDCAIRWIGFGSFWFLQESLILTATLTRLHTHMAALVARFDQARKDDIITLVGPIILDWVGVIVLACAHTIAAVGYIFLFLISCS